ncbi:HNH endonuclease [Erwinia sp. QL-Z3]|uniref:HNH endonuclease n=1 Tax=Erwinia sp. QL-Z3 TaxID=2547962 RepID=UPI001070AC89|nr:HNH endonuclease [Erwinia sp. QL-Z3]QBR52757.1 HNH endonuclease [Erwinia sp. QL-Z3]
MLTASEVKKILNYDSDSGIFTWILPASKSIKPGRVAGSISSNGYLRIKINGKSYPAHRIAWLLVHNTFPDTEIDHINGEKLDNRITNLRIASRLQNNRNVIKRKDNTSGFKGVSWQLPNKKWVARISVNRKRLTIGFFDSKEEAAEAYKQASIKYHGEFSPFKTGTDPR